MAFLFGMLCGMAATFVITLPMVIRARKQAKKQAQTVFRYRRTPKKKQPLSDADLLRHLICS